jgi:hypothetical protein
MQEEKGAEVTEEKVEEPVIDPETGKPVEEKQVEQKVDRPVENLKAELDRKNRQLEELREKVESSVAGYNPNDIRTWDDRQLQVLVATPDVKPEFKMQAQDILLDRKVERKMQHEREKARRETFETKRMEEFPETFDRSHPMSLKMEKIARDMGLDTTAAGRYAAARLASFELKPSLTKDKAKEAMTEEYGRGDVALTGRGRKERSRFMRRC